MTKPKISSDQMRLLTSEVLEVLNMIEHTLSDEDIDLLHETIKYIALCDKKGSVVAILNRDRASPAIDISRSTTTLN